MSLSLKDIKSSLYQFLSTSYAGSDIDWSDPSKFDADADDTESWVAVFIDAQRKSGRSAKDEGMVDIRVMVNSRKQDRLYETEVLTDSLLGALTRGTTVEIKDYDDSSEPTVGYVYLNDPRVEDRTEEDEVWRVAEISIQGRFQEI